jgi:hypothetical protein
MLKNNTALNKFRNRFVLTENNATQYESTGQKCLDLFSHIGSYRTAYKRTVLESFNEAFKENPLVAAKILFWVRAARKGGGERAVFHIIMEEIIKDSPKFISDNAELLAQLGYWKDLYEYFDNREVQNVIAEAIHNKDRLACKWAPRKGPQAKRLRDLLNTTNKKYRQWLKKHSETVEQQMSSEKWNDIKYESVPGKAMRSYRKAYDRHDKNERFKNWKLDDTKASVSASYPHDVMKLICHPDWMEPFLDDADFDLAEKQWRNLPDHIKEGENILPMIDVSGSMSGLPMLIAVSLGLYLSEHNKGSFKDTFLTFSGSPELIRLEESTLKERIARIVHADWGMNTDFEKAYRAILDNAVSFNVPQSAMPTMLLILSDMQFDDSQRRHRWDDRKLNEPEPVHFENIKKEFKEAGYEMPKVVFWNLRASNCEGSPALSDDDDVAMVSGFNPVLMKAILNCEEFNPMEVMFKSLKDIDVDVTNLPDELESLELALGYEDLKGYSEAY